MEHIASLSYGKDSIAMLEVIKEYDMPLDRIVHVEIFAYGDVSADLPPMVEFKEKADKIIKSRYGISVEHIRSKYTYEDVFYKVLGGNRSKFANNIYGFPMVKGAWCNSRLKMSVLRNFNKPDIIQYIGIACDEPNRFHSLSERKISPLVEYNITEIQAFDICKKLDLLSPIYNNSFRGGCWFCHNQGVEQLRFLRSNYPDYWSKLLEWDLDSPVSFKADGHTVHDYEKRFILEDEAILLPNDTTFRWKCLDDDIQLKLFA